MLLFWGSASKQHLSQYLPEKIIAVRVLYKSINFVACALYDTVFTKKNKTNISHKNCTLFYVDSLLNENHSHIKTINK